MKIPSCTSQKASWIRANVEATAKETLGKDGYRDVAYLAGRPLARDRDRRPDRVHLSNDFGQQTTGLRISDTDFIVTNTKVHGDGNGEILSARIAVEDIYEPSSTAVFEKTVRGARTVYTANYSSAEGPLGLTHRRSMDRVVFDKNGNLIECKSSVKSCPNAFGLNR